jgi:hypothetical protein
MKIKVGDKIEVRTWSSDNKEGIVNSINIALDYGDKKAEKGIEVNKYDTDLDYIGTVSYTDEYNCHHWTYFNQIIAVIPQDDFETRIFKELDKLNNLGTKYQY